MRSISHSVGNTLQRGFTLVELLIVVIILAILAAIVIPQFSGATIDAQESALDSNLSTMRSAIELYRIQHGSKYPGAMTSVGISTCGSGTASTASNAEGYLRDQLSQYSDVSGKTCSGPGTVTPLGPYLRKGIPAEPISGSSAIMVLSTGAPLTATGKVSDKTSVGGWKYDILSGQIIANNSDNDSKGVPYSSR